MRSRHGVWFGGMGCFPKPTAPGVSPWCSPYPSHPRPREQAGFVTLGLWVCPETRADPEELRGSGRPQMSRPHSRHTRGKSMTRDHHRRGSRLSVPERATAALRMGRDARSG